MTSRHRGTSPAFLPDDDNFLWEILLRLPSQSSSLLCASAVCRHWRRLVTDPQFLRRFRVHHRKPSIIGFFERNYQSVFRSIMDPPLRIPPEPFSLQGKGLRCLLGCRHGRALFHVASSKELIVCDPITGQRSYMAPPPELKDCYTVSGAVVCDADDEQGHVHGSCHSSPFKVVLVSMHRNYLRLIACVYYSKTDVWGNFTSTAVPYFHFATSVFYPGVLAGKALYWSLRSGDMIEFDMDRQSLTVIRGPPVTPICKCDIQQVIRTEDHNGVGQAILSYPYLQMWQRKVDCHGVATWTLWKTLNMYSIIGFTPTVTGRRDVIVGYAEDADVIFLHVACHVYMVHLESMQARRLHYQANYAMDCFPLTSFHTAGDCSSLVDASQEPCASRDSHWWWI